MSRPLPNGAPIRTLVVDDEPLARQLVRSLLGGAPGFQVIGEAGSGRAAIEAIRRHAPDLVFLDVEMPGVDGFEVLRRLEPAELPYVVFVTAWDQYAVDAFRVHALDYLLKPIEPERFTDCLARVEAAVSERGLSELARRVLDFAAEQGSDRGRIAGDGAGRMTVRRGGRLHSVRHADIVWLEASDQYVRIHLEEGSHLLSTSLTALEEELPGGRFVRIHRSAAVNLDFVAEVRTAKYGAHWVHLTTGERLRLSRGRRELLPRLLAAAGRD